MATITTTTIIIIVDIEFIQENIIKTQNK